jgi:hypothetical protein
MAEAERRGGLNKGFIGDIVRGTKTTIHGVNIGKLAKAIDVSTADVIAAATGNAKAVQGVEEVDQPYRPTSLLPAQARPGAQPFPGAIAEAELRPGSANTGDMDILDWWLIPGPVVRSDLRAKPENLVVVRTRSDAMEPEIMRSDYVVVDTSRRQVEEGGIWAIDEGFGVLFKRIVPRREQGGVTLVLTSANQRYPEETRAMDEVTIVGRCVGRFTLL